MSTFVYNLHLHVLNILRIRIHACIKRRDEIVIFEYHDCLNVSRMRSFIVTKVMLYVSWFIRKFIKPSSTRSFFI